MFTGVIEEVGRIEEIEELGGSRRLRVACSFASELRPDQSIAVNGVCQTVVRFYERAFETVAIEETLSKTTLGRLAGGDSVNLERAMLLGDRLDGHIVQGHVDATGVIEEITVLEGSRLFRISFDPRYASSLIPVGSVAVDGISLTVARLGEADFTVAIIPHTFERTNVSSWRVGGGLNLEFDVVGKYVRRIVDSG